ncbi:MAG: hypothetical protein ACRDWY_00420 [Actinomycetes bacterium]
MTSLGQVADRDEVRGRAPVPFRTPGRVPATMLRPKPQRVPELAHMDLKRLRRYRRTLLDEELRASYWRRLLQARRDVLRSREALVDRAALTDALTEQRGTAGRQVILSLHPDSGMPILPHLPDLWASGVGEQDEADRAELFARLASAESVLSSYREALFKRLDRATEDLVARYHDDPRQCFVALPLEG